MFFGLFFSFKVRLMYETVLNSIKHLKDTVKLL